MAAAKNLVAFLITLLFGQIAVAQVIQLPTYRVFSTNGTVVVRDRGSVYAGGNTTGRAGGVSHGVPTLGRMPGASRVFRSNARSSQFGTSKARVSATIIDHKEWDRGVLAAAAARRAPDQSPANDPRFRAAAFLSRNVARASVMTSAESHLAVADAETDTPATASFREYMQLGRAAQSRGDYAAARDYFLQAAKVADVGRSR